MRRTWRLLLGIGLILALGPPGPPEPVEHRLTFPGDIRTWTYRSTGSERRVLVRGDPETIHPEDRPPLDGLYLAGWNEEGRDAWVVETGMALVVYERRWIDYRRTPAIVPAFVLPFHACPGEAPRQVGGLAWPLWSERLAPRPISTPAGTFHCEGATVRDIYGSRTTAWLADEVGPVRLIHAPPHGGGKVWNLVSFGR